ncbi:MAG: hypothetical protein AUG51_23355 [Acidobacteria bacterium 13_1_20CM_3_53_8]|nr:MAG: hypothetical protein AUG51_23355 [Acidobacteria bacterium 13_1_20CM_3_53_8]
MSLFGGISSLLGGGGSGGGGGLGNVFNQVSSFGQQVVHVVDHADPNILNMHDQIQSLIGEGHTVIPVNGIGGNLEQIVQQISSQVPRGSIGSLNFFSSGLTGEHSPLLDSAGDMVAQFGGVGAHNFDQAGGVFQHLQEFMNPNAVGGLNFFGSSMGQMNGGHELLDSFSNVLGTSANAIPMGQFMGMLEEVREAA